YSSRERYGTFIAKIGLIGKTGKALGVEPEHRRKGLGRKFITHAIDELADLPEIRTGTTLPNPATYNLLKDTGFVTDSVTPKKTHSLYVKGPE
ncbi:MAG: GNAT family N-acetyltransferase, partial [Theionarchaea archaeon]|nr:GNAT family N-acetyltransferase [Theionarchaea archaeon]